MITKFENFNESIKSLLVGPTKEEVWDDLINGKLKGLITSIPDSPEDFFNKMVEVSELLGKTKDFIWYGKNDIPLFIIQNKNNIFDKRSNRYIYINQEYIWSILTSIYNIKISEVTTFIKNQLDKNNTFKGYKISNYFRV